jgi:putative addiction module component (TIGR02574 family)
LNAAEIIESARRLSPEEQLKIIDSLFDMLNESDPAINAAWAVEAQSRLAAYQSGEMKSAPIESLFEQMRLQ